MVLAGEGTPTQAIVLGLLWVVWFGVIAIWPREAFELFRRQRRWQRGGSDDWPVPQVHEEPTEPGDRVFTAYRLVAIALAVMGVVLTVNGITRL